MFWSHFKNLEKKEKEGENGAWTQEELIDRNSHGTVPLYGQIYAHTACMYCTVCVQDMQISEICGRLIRILAGRRGGETCAAEKLRNIYILLYA